MVRTVVRYHRYDTASEMLLLNEICLLQSKLTNYYHPQQKQMSKVRHGATVTNKYDTGATRFRRLINHPSMTDEGRIVALTLAQSKIQPRPRPTPDPGLGESTPNNDHQQSQCRCQQTRTPT